MSKNPELAKNVKTGIRVVARGAIRGGITLARFVLEPTLLGRTPGATLREMENDETNKLDVAAREKIIDKLDIVWALSMLRFLASLPVVMVTDAINSSMNKANSLSDHWLYLIPAAYLAEFVFNVLYRTGWDKNHPKTESDDQNPVM